MGSGGSGAEAKLFRPYKVVRGDVSLQLFEDDNLE